MSVDVGKAVGYLELDTSNFKRGFAAAQNDMKKFHDSNATFNDKLKATGSAMENVGKSLSKNVTIPLAAMGAGVITAGVQFESAFAGVRKTVDATDTEFKTLESGIKNMSRNMPQSASAFAGIAEAAGQLGIEVPNILKFTETMAMLGDATNLSSEEAATALARLANITQMPQTEFDKLGSVIVALGNNLATTESEIVNMSLRLAGAGKQIGLSEAQILSFSGALSSVGIEAEAGGSAISKVMVEMQLAVETGGEALDDFSRVARMSTEEFQEAFEQDAAGALIAFISGLQDTTELGMSAIAVLDDMGISEVRMRDALLRAAGAGDLFSDALQLGTKAWAENTALTKEAEQRYETTASKLAILKNRLVDVGLQFSDVILPAFSDFVSFVSDGIEKFSGLDDGLKKTIVSVGLFAAATGPVLLIGSKLITGFLSIKGALAGITIGAKAATVATAGAGVAATGAGAGFLAALAPLAPWIAGIAAVTGGFILLKNTLSKEATPEIDLFANKVETINDNMQYYGRGVASTGQTIVTEISEATKQAVGAYVELDDEATRNLTNLYVKSDEITEDIKNSAVAHYTEMTRLIIQGLDNRYNEEYAMMQEFFANSQALTEEEEQKALEKMTESNEERKAKEQEYTEQIQNILQTASDEKRGLTLSEAQEIAEIQAQMKETAITLLSETEVEAQIILQRIKDYGTRISTEQASEVIKEAEEQRAGVVEQATKQYEETVASIIRMRDEAKAITSEQAEALIEEARRQKDESITEAEEMKKNVVEKISEMNEDITDSVDTTTGKILTFWDKIKRWWSDWEPESKQFSYSVQGGAYPSTSDGSFAGGLPYVPYDGFQATLHKGERVLTAEEAKASRQEVKHTGTIRVEGVNSSGELLEIVDIIVDDIDRQERRNR